MKNLKHNEKIRNIAIIAHVDHGKTTLVDHMFRQSGMFRDNQEVEDRVMDSMDLERERGITISAKNCSVVWNGVKINILDTPGHADFGGEVERALMMVDGAILLVDASEGPLPQTRFVLKKALTSDKKIVVVVNKIDRKDARAKEVLDEIYSLFMDLDATEEQIDFPILYAIGRQGIAQETLETPGVDLAPLFNMIVSEIPGPTYSDEEPFQLLVTDLDYSDYIGRLAIGKVANGTAHINDSLICINEEGRQNPLKITKLQVYDGIKLKETETIEAGEIAILAGIENVHIGDTICAKDNPKGLKRIVVDEPTISMVFAINTSPFSGMDGKYVQSAKLKERLFKETLRNVALKFEESDSADTFILKGRGEFQMVILIETLRREGYEMSVGRPHVIYKQKDGKRLEPIEHLFIDCEESFVGVVTDKLSRRKGRMVNLVNHGTGRVRVEFTIPSRGLIGYRNEFLTDTKGTGIMNSYLESYEEHRGDFPIRTTGSLVSDRQGQTTGYALFNLEPRGTLFCAPGENVYEGMIVGEHNRDNDLNVNSCKPKKLSNMRASSKDESIILTPVTPMTLEKAIEFINDDEIVEVTPKNIRLRKVILAAQKRDNASKS
ncbi:MAG: translational GTPase TypA [Ignavibacteria bacterium]|nr:translational GTPase TypA [Ignavibacteria bacterium]MCC7158295.1 translational GTPase TypA [Ignavibacteria bacterium]